MHKYNLPRIKKDEEKESMATAIDSGSFPSEWDRKITIPVNDDIMKSLEVGENVDITLTGRVSEMINHKNEDGRENRKTITLDLESVETMNSHESDENDFENGFGNGPKRKNINY